MRKITNLLFILLSLLFVSACNNKPNVDAGRSKIIGICRGQNIFFKKNGHYGTLKELVPEKLADDDFFRGWGYTSNIKLTETGYLATMIPDDFHDSPMFYVDEKRVIKVHYGDDKTQSDDSECSYPNGAKCPCYDD